MRVLQSSTALCWWGPFEVAAKWIRVRPRWSLMNCQQIASPISHKNVSFITIVVDRYLIDANREKSGPTSTSPHTRRYSRHRSCGHLIMSHMGTVRWAIPFVRCLLVYRAIHIAVRCFPQKPLPSNKLYTWLCTQEFRTSERAGEEVKWAENGTAGRRRGGRQGVTAHRPRGGRQTNGARCLWRTSTRVLLRFLLWVRSFYVCI